MNLYKIRVRSLNFITDYTVIYAFNLYKKFTIWNYVRKLDRYIDKPGIKLFWTISNTLGYSLVLYAYTLSESYTKVYKSQIIAPIMYSKEELNYFFKLTYNKNCFFQFYSGDPTQFEVNLDQIIWNDKEEEFKYKLSKLLKE